MSRSYRKTPIFGNAGGSEKFDKRINNRMFRRKEKLCCTTHNFDLVPLKMKEVRNRWAMKKDGKQYTHILTAPWNSWYKMMGK